MFHGLDDNDTDNNETYVVFKGSSMRKIPNPRRLISGLFPILRWSRSYDVGQAAGDLIAGITIALTLIPQSMAYASLAGFEPQYGLYASFIGGFVYALMGTCPQVNIGPSALLSLLTFTYTNGTNADFAVLLCLMAGIVQLVAGFAQLGFLVEFVSLPVVSGFTSAAALTIASAQIKGLLGLKFSADTFMDTWKNLFKHIGQTRMPDTLLSLSCCIVLMGLRWVSRTSTDYKGKVTPGLPTPQPPAFETIVGNRTYTAGQMLSHLGTGLIIVPMIGILSNVAIAKAFAKGKTLDATQEIVALGFCSVISSFFRSMPVNGSFSRSAVSEASGVRTPGAGLYTGVIVILTLVLLTPYFYFIPRAALASVIVCAVLNMVDIAILKRLWKTSRPDLIPLLGCFVCCLGLGIEVGLICGVGFDAILLLYYQSRPPLDVKYVNDGILPPHYAIRPVGGLSFAGAERVRSKLLALKRPKEIPVIRITTIDSLTVLPDNNMTVNGTALTNDVEASAVRPAEVLIIYCDSLYRLDYTFSQSLKMLVIDWRRSGRVIFCNVKPAVKEQLSHVLQDAIYCDTEQLRTCLASTINELHNTSDTAL
ncbi:unnamed protein product [Arctia plantaginis]|uniref:SLC26A/SulP transporter domain-containing protein n=1 Tax=Arctia plantaginis TaxID=874455 RepID=A0A8S0YWF2_ARCPL|nr:unnamed protein product [Arctia plantaginis]